MVLVADVPVSKKAKLALPDTAITGREPPVKYRGIFLNDEGRGLNPWASKTFDRELSNIGPKTYNKVCELIMRLGDNMLAPAMHGCSTAFYQNPENKVVADRHGVIITTSHCEPLLFGNVNGREWNKQRDGEWNWLSNRATIEKKFDDRVAEAGMTSLGPLLREWGY